MREKREDKCGRDRGGGKSVKESWKRKEREKEEKERKKTEKAV